MLGTTITKRLLVLIAAGSVAAMVAGCRENEQGRPLAFDKGVYGGQADQQISDETRKQLQDRVRLQNFN
ncbi:MAG: hypothetical protein AAGD23_07035 [Pseudomonadota bacterium]